MQPPQSLKTRIQKHKPEITPPRRRGGNFHGGGSFGNRGQGRQNAEDNRRNPNNNAFRPRGQNFNNRGNKRWDKPKLKLQTKRKIWGQGQI